MKSRNSAKRKRRKIRANLFRIEQRQEVKLLNREGTDDLEKIEKPEFLNEEQSQMWDHILKIFRRKGIRKATPNDFLLFVLEKASELEMSKKEKRVEELWKALRDADHQADIAIEKLKWLNGNNPETNAFLDRFNRRAKSNFRVINGTEEEEEEEEESVNDESKETDE